MPWFKQLVHVLAKDVRAQRWLLLVYLSLLVFATAGQLSVGRPGDLAVAAVEDASRRSYDASVESHDMTIVSTGDFAMAISPDPVSSSIADLLTPLVAVMLCALIVLADSPTQPRAQWASLPYRRSAVWGAKIFFVVVLISAAAVAWSVPLIVLQVPFPEIPARLFSLAMLWLAMCVVALLLASASANFQSVVLLGVLLLIAWSLSGIFISQPNGGWVLPKMISLLVEPMIVILSLWWLYVVYRTRARAKSVRFASVALASLMLAPDMIGLHAPIPALRTASEALPGTVVSSRLETRRGAGSDSLTRTWHLYVAGLPSSVRASMQHGYHFSAGQSSDCRTTFLATASPALRTLQVPSLPIDTACLLYTSDAADE